MSIEELKNYKEALKQAGIDYEEKRVALGSVVDLAIIEKVTGNQELTAVLISDQSEKVQGIEEIEVQSPLGRAIMNREIDETFKYTVLNQEKEATIMNIYSNVDEYKEELENRKRK